MYSFSVFEKAGKKPSYVNAIKMVDNYLPGFEIQHQIETAGEKKIDEHIDEVVRDIKERNCNVHTVGIGGKIGMALIHGTMGKAILKGTAAQDYIVNDSCVKCGICAKVCPANNITVNDKVVFSNHCEVCYACIHNCPKNAIHLKNEKSAVRFRNENVTMQEIMSANG